MAGLAVMFLLSSLTVPSLPGSQPALSYLMSPANTVSCREKDKKLLEEVESAQLAAHRLEQFTFLGYQISRILRFWRNVGIIFLFSQSQSFDWSWCSLVRA